MKIIDHKPYRSAHLDKILFIVKNEHWEEPTVLYHGNNVHKAISVYNRNV